MRHKMSTYSNKARLEVSRNRNTNTLHPISPSNIRNKFGLGANEDPRRRKTNLQVLGF